MTALTPMPELTEIVNLSDEQLTYNAITLGAHAAGMSRASWLKMRLVELHQEDLLLPRAVPGMGGR